MRPPTEDRHHQMMADGAGCAHPLGVASAGPEELATVTARGAALRSTRRKHRVGVAHVRVGAERDGSARRDPGGQDALVTCDSDTAPRLPGLDAYRPRTRPGVGLVVSEAVGSRSQVGPSR